MKIIGLSVGTRESGARILTAQAELAPGEALEAEDMARLLDVLNEAAGGDAPEPAAEAAPSRRRRSAPEPEAEAEAAPSRRRRSAPAAEEAAEEEAAAPSRRRRGGAAAEEDTSSADTSAPAPRRRRAAPEPEQPKDDTITDEDLAKACSAAARVIGPKEVTALVEEFSVSKVQEIESQEDRKEFLGLLQADVEKA